MPVMGSIDRRLLAVVIGLVGLIAVVLALTVFHDSVNQMLAGAQGCPHYIPESYALNAGCPLDVHPWLLP